MIKLFQNFQQKKKKKNRFATVNEKCLKNCFFHVREDLKDVVIGRGNSGNCLKSKERS